ncbi:Ubiquitin domain-containing protein 7SL RNA1 [Cardamine amara subsp. amara]|uniref:Ubiquitin domain-containing protein 7SL RNA1 n=1 Tax=Cardamine amara subsp. amara TaxID=228776 RepID=A0ABD1B6Q9_CARAN
MKLFCEILSGSSFEIEVDKSDTLLLVKQKIEKSQNIPVSKQFLAVNGVVILRDDLNVEQCQIVQESRLQVFISPEQKNPNHNNDQVLQPPAPYNSVEEYFAWQGWPMTDEEIRKIYSYQPKESQTSSNSFREHTNVQDSAVNKIPVFVSLPSLGENDAAKSFLFFVNKTDHVGKLRTLIGDALGNQSRLRDGYFLMHKERVLCEDQSFQCHGVDHFDSIEIVHGP